METTEKIVEAYVRYAKGWFTLPNIRCTGQFEIDLLAIDPSDQPRGRYHIESGVSISGGFARLTSKEFSQAKLKIRVETAGGDVRDFFREFYLRLHEIPALIEQEPANARWGVLTRHVLDYCRERTLSNVNGISAVMLMLGTDDPWRRIGGRAGVNERGLRDQIANIAKRRNDIIHRGDRPVGRPDEGPQPIDFAWTHSHVNAVQSVVLACDALAEDSVKQLKADAGGP